MANNEPKVLVDAPKKTPDTFDNGGQETPVDVVTEPKKQEVNRYVKLPKMREWYVVETKDENTTFILNKDLEPGLYLIELKNGEVAWQIGLIYFNYVDEDNNTPVSTSFPDYVTDYTTYYLAAGKPNELWLTNIEVEEVSSGVDIKELYLTKLF